MFDEWVAFCAIPMLRNAFAYATTKLFEAVDRAPIVASSYHEGTAAAEDDEASDETTASIFVPVEADLPTYPEEFTSVEADLPTYPDEFTVTNVEADQTAASTAFYRALTTLANDAASTAL